MAKSYKKGKELDSFNAEFLLEGISFRTQFPSLGIFINKNVGF